MRLITAVLIAASVPAAAQGPPRVRRRRARVVAGQALQGREPCTACLLGPDVPRSSGRRRSRSRSSTWRRYAGGLTATRRGRRHADQVPALRSGRTGAASASARWTRTRTRPCPPSCGTPSWNGSSRTRSAPRIPRGRSIVDGLADAAGIPPRRPPLRDHPRRPAPGRVPQGLRRHAGHPGGGDPRSRRRSPRASRTSRRSSKARRWTSSPMRAPPTASTPGPCSRRGCSTCSSGTGTATSASGTGSG